MALCKNPIYNKDVGGLAGCGQCLPCRINKCRFWTFRLCMEAKAAEATWWTTLTYNREFLPTEYIHPDTGQVFESSTGCLRPDHIELFIKRVRRALPPASFRYFLAGEYGDDDLRPHYHICVFGYGQEIQPLLERCWTDPVSRRSFGFVDRKKCGPLTTENMRYTCGYTIKKLTKVDDSRLEGRYPEFTSHSQGIGMVFAERFAAAINTPSGMAHILATGDIPRSVRFDGRWWPLDRYLREKIIDILGCRDALLAKGKERFSKEMRALSNRAELNKVFGAALEISPNVMRMQYLSENRQKILNATSRATRKT